MTTSIWGQEAHGDFNLNIKTSKSTYIRKLSFLRFTKAELQVFIAVLNRIVKSKEFQVASLSDQKLVMKELVEMRAHFDLNYPSKWAGNKSRGWYYDDMASEYKSVEGREERVKVWFPKKFDEATKPLKGVRFGKLVTTFITKGRWGTCQNFVLIPTEGKGFALVDVGGSSCNYGQKITSVPSPYKVVYSPNYSKPECSQAYCPTVVSTEGYDFTKERSFLEQ